jgi:hypothetical protein
MDEFEGVGRIYQLAPASRFEGVLELVNPRFAELVQAGVKMC